MPLEEKRSHHEAIKIAVIGLTLVAFTWAVTRSTLPTVGDPYHNLPHGGHYQDGTKRVDYCGPRKAIHSKPSEHLWVLLLILALSAAIYATSRPAAAPLHPSGHLHFVPPPPAREGMRAHDHGGVPDFNQL
ncbi:MAG: ORF9 protein [Hibiscus virus X]